MLRPIFNSALRGVFRGITGVAGAGGGISSLFSTDLWTGNGSTQTITNGLDFANEDGLVWIKDRGNVNNHSLFDTSRGETKWLASNLTNAEITTVNSLVSFDDEGYSLGGYSTTNANGNSYVGWSFKKAPKFFDIIRYTGNGVAGREIPHELGVQVGMCVIKRLDATSPWYVQHVSRGGSSILLLNSDSPESTGGSGWWNNTAMTDTEVTLGTNSNVNASGGEYIMYVFAHDIAADGVIQCGGYTGDGTNSNQVDLETSWTEGIQYVMIKRVTGGIGDWMVFDTTRGVGAGGSDDKLLKPNESSAEGAVSQITFNTGGFELNNAGGNLNASGSEYIYMVIREEG